VSSVPIEVPEAVRRKALALGPPGGRWLSRLGTVVAELERAWQFRVGPPLAGGSAAYVAADAVMADGTDAVLKIGIPDGLDGQGDFARELATLERAAGHGYVRVLYADGSRRAMLQERLGRSLSELRLPVDMQIEIIATTLGQSWCRPSPVRIRTGREQAREVARCVTTWWNDLGRPCATATIRQAIDSAHARCNAFDPTTAVLIHGDAHPANVLEAVPNAGPHGEFKLIDPDGMLSEPAHDLGIPLRDWSVELNAADDPVALGLRWCAHLGRVTGVDSRAIWQWAFLERVSTGLFLHKLGDPYASQLLTVAAAWTGHEPD